MHVEPLGEPGLVGGEFRACVGFGGGLGGGVIWGLGGLGWGGGMVVCVSRRHPHTYIDNNCQRTAVDVGVEGQGGEEVEVVEEGGAGTEVVVGLFWRWCVNVCVGI